MRLLSSVEELVVVVDAKGCRFRLSTGVELVSFRMAAECARDALLQQVLDNKEIFMADLMKIAKTTLSSKILSQDEEQFAKLAVDASYEDAVHDSRVLRGGGWPEMVTAKEVDELARVTPGKKPHAIEAFSWALIPIPTVIAENAGVDSAELVAQLRAEHRKEGCSSGTDVISGSVSGSINNFIKCKL
ncbi:T-complex protein [Salix suchowensis]|nr:T-complex protein [Salix suchowensis]